VIAHFCIVRADIPRGLQAAQIIHAAGESSSGSVPPGTYAIALSTSDEAELDGLSHRLFLAGIPHRRIIENDAPWSGQLMAIGIFPQPRRSLRRYLSHLKTIK
jgi:hypothetical protein